MDRYTVLAFDFGASSGRAILATLEGKALSTREIHRFENIPVTREGALRWNVESLFREVQVGIQKAGAFDSIGFDTWGVDFGLLDEKGRLLEAPVHYRDSRTEGARAQVSQHLSETLLYKETGNQIMNINTLFQLVSLQKQRPELLAKAKTLLFMPDLFAYQLTGKPACEMSIASTSQMFHPESKRWSTDLLKALSLPEEILLKPVPSGTVTGSYGGAKVIAVAGHDTQCAVAAIPSSKAEVVFLSCGTWSLLGTELDTPILTEESRKMELSNEIGFGGKINYLKNIIGLWLIQESRREWERQGQSYGFGDLEREALAAPPLGSFIDPDHPSFAVPGDIPQRVREYCKTTGQYQPQTVGEVVRCIYESLALKYHMGVKQLEGMTHKSFQTLHILGGGAQAKLLCQMTANSCQLPVIAGPVEATALGNIIIQLVALGALDSIEQGRTLLAETQQLDQYSPCDAAAWNEAYARFTKLL